MVEPFEASSRKSRGYCSGPSQYTMVARKEGRAAEKEKPKSLKYSLLSGWTDSRVRQGRPSARFEEAAEASITR